LPLNITVEFSLPGVEKKLPFDGFLAGLHLPSPSRFSRTLNTLRSLMLTSRGVAHGLLSDLSMFHSKRKAVRKMKSVRSVLSVLFLALALWFSAVSYVEACDHDDDVEFEDDAQR
jgi:hypothetical protein